jgi:HrpA-like RNA helicase
LRRYAALESEKFSLYFNECPVYHVPGRGGAR